MAPSRSNTVSVVVNYKTIETAGERQIRFQLFETKHEMSIEAVVEDLRAAYPALSKEPSPGRELDLGRLENWKWENEDGLKQRFFERLSHLGVSV